MKDKTLLFLHGSTAPVAETDLVSWTEHSNRAVYRRDILRRAHKEKLIEYNADAKTAVISPLGVAYVEEKLLGTGA